MAQSQIATYWLFSSQMALFTGRWWDVVPCLPRALPWAELNCPFRASRCQRDQWSSSCVSKSLTWAFHLFIFLQIIGYPKFTFSIEVLLAFSFWLLALLPIANSQQPISSKSPRDNNHPPVCQNLSWKFHIMGSGFYVLFRIHSRSLSWRKWLGSVLAPWGILLFTGT